MTRPLQNKNTTFKLGTFYYYYYYYCLTRTSCHQEVIKSQPARFTMTKRHFWRSPQKFYYTKFVKGKIGLLSSLAQI